jgi:hypothetical protein
VSGFAQRIQGFVDEAGRASVYLHVGVLMMDLAMLPVLETMSLNPSAFNGVYADSGSGLLYYLNSLRGPAQSPAPHHATGQEEKGEAWKGGREREGRGEGKGGVTFQSPTKSFDPLRILEYPTTKGGSWSATYRTHPHTPTHPHT